MRGRAGRHFVGRWTRRSQSPDEGTNQANRGGQAARRQAPEQPHPARDHPGPSQRRQQLRRSDAKPDTAGRKSPGPTTQPHPGHSVLASPLTRSWPPPHPYDTTALQFATTNDEWTRSMFNDSQQHNRAELHLAPDRSIPTTANGSHGACSQNAVPEQLARPTDARRASSYGAIRATPQRATLRTQPDQT